MKVSIPINANALPSFFLKMHALISLLLAPPTQCSSSTNSPNAQTHGKPAEIFFLRSTVKHLKTPYPHFTQSKPTIPTKQQRSPSLEQRSHFSDPENPNIYIYIYLFILTQLYNQSKKKKKKLFLPILSLL